MGRVFLRYVEAETVHCCAACRAHLAAHEAIISKAFQGRHGRAYLFADVVNVNSGPTENRLLLTGLHVVADIYCNACDTRLGWKYVEAFEESQKYKEGERPRMHPSRDCALVLRGRATKASAAGHAPRRELARVLTHHFACLTGKFILEKAMIMKEEELRQRRAEQLERLEEQRQRAARGEALSGDATLDEQEDGEEGEEGDEGEEGEEEGEEEEGEDGEEGTGGGGGTRNGGVASHDASPLPTLAQMADAMAAERP